MRSITQLELQYAHRFYGFQGEAQYLHGHTGVLTIEVEDTINVGVNMIFPCNEILKTAWNVLKNFVQMIRCCPQFWMCMKSRVSRGELQIIQ